MSDADVTSSAGSPACGDMITFYLKVDGDRIERLTFESYGCASNIATASYLTEMVQGKSLKEAFFTPWKQVAEELGGLPAVKTHCGVLAVGALQRTIRAYYDRTGSVPDWVPGEFTREEKHALEEEELAEKTRDKLGEHADS
jgi:nitrogen fixation NifU-like protein